jgi:protein tyrosine phosphatase (PTP) superfamily phosphohydrolase (DUF442 family)
VALADITNFVAIDDRLATAGQPTEEQLAEIVEAGFETVVNLGLLDQDYSLVDEAGSVCELGLRYVHIPVSFTAPTVEDFQQFRETLREHAGRKVLVHCAMNMRVSCFMALYGEAELGWSRTEADAHVRRIWEPNEVWSAYLEQMRAAPLPPR